jgi:hypothetical protein
MRLRNVVPCTLVFLSACGGPSAPVPTSPTAPSAPATSAAPVPVGPIARFSVTIDQRGSLSAIAALSTVILDASGSSGTGLRFGLDFGDGHGVDEAVASHVYAFGDRTYKARAIVTDAMGRTDSAFFDVVVKTAEGDWFNSFYNTALRRYEGRTLSITQAGLSLKGTYAHPEGNRSAFTGELLPERTASVRLTDGTITFGNSSDVGFNSDATRLTVTVRGGSADGQTLTFTRSTYSNY